MSPVSEHHRHRIKLGGNGGWTGRDHECYCGGAPKGDAKHGVGAKHNTELLQDGPPSAPTPPHTHSAPPSCSAPNDLLLCSSHHCPAGVERVTSSSSSPLVQQVRLVAAWSLGAPLGAPSPPTPEEWRILLSPRAEGVLGLRGPSVGGCCSGRKRAQLAAQNRVTSLSSALIYHLLPVTHTHTSSPIIKERAFISCLHSPSHLAHPLHLPPPLPLLDHFLLFFPFPPLSPPPLLLLISSSFSSSSSLSSPSTPPASPPPLLLHLFPLLSSSSPSTPPPPLPPSSPSPPPPLPLPFSLLPGWTVDQSGTEKLS